MGTLKGLTENKSFPFPDGMRGFRYKKTSITYTKSLTDSGQIGRRGNEIVWSRHLALGKPLPQADLDKVLEHFGYDLTKPINATTHRQLDGTTYTYIQEIFSE